jgi:polar amino acid transport system substrate-binding protein
MNRRGLFAAGALAAVASPFVVRPAHAQGASESLFDRINRTKVFRCAGVVGAEPYFSKNIATGEWSGFAIAMARDIAATFEAELQIVESTWGNSVLDLQADKIDVSFGLNPTPKRALVVDFTDPLFFTSFTAVCRDGFEARTWADLNDQDVRIAVDIGSTHELIARRMAGNANISGFKTQDEAIMAVQAGRADCFVMTVILALAAKQKNSALGQMIIPTPVLSAPGAAALRNEPDRRMRDFLNAWTAYNRGMGQTREWILAALENMGIARDSIPAEVSF